MPDYGPLMGAVPVQKSLGKVPKGGFPKKPAGPGERAMRRSSSERPGAARIKKAAR